MLKCARALTSTRGEMSFQRLKLLWTRFTFVITPVKVKKVNWRTCNLWLPGVRPSGIKKVNQWSSNVRASKQSYVDIVCK